MEKPADGMIISIPGREAFRIEHLLLDSNGTIALDGRIIDGVVPRIEELAGRLNIRILTADTLGTAAETFTGLPADLEVIDQGHGAERKRTVLRGLGAGKCAAIGNGEIDRLLLGEAALGIAVIGPEGASPRTILAADVVTRNILDALDLLLTPKRLTATLRD
jgi:soluble P-type ATPase